MINHLRENISEPLNGFIIVRPKNIDSITQDSPNSREKTNVTQDHYDGI